MKLSARLDLFSLIAWAIAAWVLLAGTIDLVSPEPFNLHDFMQSAYEYVGGMDDDNDTGYVINIFFLPILSLAFALLGLFYNKILKRSLRLSLMTVLVSVLAFSPFALIALSVGWVPWQGSITSQRPPSEEFTNSATACTTNADCSCRIFTGAEFLPGLQEGRCCLPDDNNRAGCEQNYYCADCIYE